MNGNTRHAAVAEWQNAAAAGVVLTGVELAERFGRSPSWGRSVARQARQAAAPAAADHQHGGTSGTVDDTPAYPQPDTTPTAATTTPTAADTTPAAADTAAAAAADDVPAWVGWVTVTAVLAVALAAAVASVDHLAALARLAGTAGWRAWLLPVAVDGLATAAALTLYRAHRTGTAAGWLPWAALTAGLAASVAGNVTSVYPELVDVGTLKIAVGATPPVSLALAVELALRQVRSR